MAWLGEDYPDVAGAVAERIQRYRDLVADGSTIEEPVRDAVRYAASRVPIAIVSGAARGEIVPVVRAAGLEPCFGTIVSSDDVTEGKPHPESYLRALELLGVARRRSGGFRGHRVRHRLGNGSRDALHRGSRHACARAPGRGRRADRGDRHRHRPAPARRPLTRPFVIAHRGASAELPENTLPAFERAIEYGADFVELDVHARPDGELVVTHDQPRGRTVAPDARGGTRPLPWPDRGDGGAEDAYRYRRHRMIERTLALLDEDAVVVCFEAGAIARVARSAAGAADGSARRASCRSGWRRLAGAGRSASRTVARRRAAIRAARRLGLRRPSTRSTGRRACSSSRHSA